MGWHVGSSEPDAKNRIDRLHQPTDRAARSTRARLPPAMVWVLYPVPATVPPAAVSLRHGCCPN